MQSHPRTPGWVSEPIQRLSKCRGGAALWTLGQEGLFCLWWPPELDPQTGGNRAPSTNWVASPHHPSQAQLKSLEQTHSQTHPAGAEGKARESAGLWWDSGPRWPGRGCASLPGLGTDVAGQRAAVANGQGSEGSERGSWAGGGRGSCLGRCVLGLSALFLPHLCRASLSLRALPLPSPCPHLPPVALSLFLPPLSPSPFFSVSLLVLVSLCPRPSLAVGLPLCPFPALRLMCVPAPPPVFLSASYPSARSASASLSLHPSLWPHPDFRLPRPAPTPLSPPSSPSPSLSSPPVGHRWDPSS